MQLPSNIPTHVHQKIAGAIVPVVYTEAINALAKCRTIDEGKYYADKADALAAWAKIYKSDEAAIEARKLKAHAFRRMGQLAEELRPTKLGGTPGQHKGNKGASSLLLESGLSKKQAVEIRRMSALPEATFQREMERARPFTVQRISRLAIGTLNQGASAAKAKSAAWRLLLSTSSYSGVPTMLQFCKKNSAYEIGRAIPAGEVRAIREKLRPIREWMDEFEASLVEG